MTFTERLREQTDWEAATRHRFVEQYREGSLDDSVFRNYLIDDYAFLETGARVTALAAADAPSMEEMARIAEQLGVLTGGENDYFVRAFDELGVSADEYENPELHPTTEAFIDFMHRIAREGGYDETLAAVAAAEWVYLDWCNYAAEAEYDRWYLDEWVELHVVDEFAGYVGWLRGQLDERGPRLSGERTDRVAEVFDRTVELEARFFEAAYE